MDKSRTPFPQLRLNFSVYNRTTNKSPRTVAWYEQRLELFERYLGATATLADVTAANHTAPGNRLWRGLLAVRSALGTRSRPRPPDTNMVPAGPGSPVAIRPPAIPRAGV